MTVLVGYATYRGSTRDIAERVAERLEMAGLPVDLLEVDDVDDVSVYEAVVLGSAIHSGAWLPEAAAFVEANQAALRRRPVWLFSVSTLGDAGSAFGRWTTARLRSMLAKRGATAETPATVRLHDAIDARGHRGFAGVIARGDWPWFARLLFRAFGGRFGDHRDWADIEAWADEVAGAVRAEDVTARMTRLRHLRAA